MDGVVECAIEWVRGQSYAGVTAYNNSRLKGRIEKLAKLYPNDVEKLVVNPDGSIFAHVPVKWIKVSPPKQVSDEQRAAAGERLKALRQKRLDEDQIEEEDEEEDE